MATENPCLSSFPHGRWKRSWILLYVTLAWLMGHLPVSSESSVKRSSSVHLNFSTSCEVVPATVAHDHAPFGTDMLSSWCPRFRLPTIRGKSFDSSCTRRCHTSYATARLHRIISNYYHFTALLFLSFYFLLFFSSLCSTPKLAAMFRSFSTPSEQRFAIWSLRLWPSYTTRRFCNLKASMLSSSHVFFMSRTSKICSTKEAFGVHSETFSSLLQPLIGWGLHSYESSSTSLRAVRRMEITALFTEVGSIRKYGNGCW